MNRTWSCVVLLAIGAGLSASCAVHSDGHTKGRDVPLAGGRQFARLTNIATYQPINVVTPTVFRYRDADLPPDDPDSSGWVILSGAASPVPIDTTFASPPGPDTAGDAKAGKSSSSTASLQIRQGWGVWIGVNPLPTTKRIRGGSPGLHTGAASVELKGSTCVGIYMGSTVDGEPYEVCAVWNAPPLDGRSIIFEAQDVAQPPVAVTFPVVSGYYKIFWDSRKSVDGNLCGPGDNCQGPGISIGSPEQIGLAALQVMKNACVAQGLPPPPLP